MELRVSDVRSLGTESSADCRRSLLFGRKGGRTKDGLFHGMSLCAVFTPRRQKSRNPNSPCCLEYGTPAADVDSPFQFVAEDGFMSAPLRNFVLAPVEVFGGIMQMNVLSESSTGSGGRTFSHRPRHFATLF